MSTKRKIKGAARSRTVWFNAVVGSATAALPMLETALPGLREHLPQQIYSVALLVIVVGNIVLRAVTTTALEDKAPAQTTSTGGQGGQP